MAAGNLIGRSGHLSARETTTPPAVGVRQDVAADDGLGLGVGIGLGVGTGLVELAYDPADRLPVVRHCGAGEPLAPPLSKDASGM